MPKTEFPYWDEDFDDIQAYMFDTSGIPLMGKMKALEESSRERWDNFDRNSWMDNHEMSLKSLYQNASASAERRYYKKVNQLKGKYGGTDYFDSELKAYHKKIFDEVNKKDNVYTEALQRADKLGISETSHREILTICFEIISEDALCVRRLRMLRKFLYRTTDVIINKIIYKRFIEKSYTSLKDVFKDKDKYDEVFKRLSQEEILFSTADKYIWNFQHSSLNGLRVKTLICEFGIALQHKGYIKANVSNKLMVKLLKNTFSFPNSEHFKEDSGYYGKLKNSRDSSISEKRAEYKAVFNCIRSQNHN